MAAAALLDLDWECAGAGSPASDAAGSGASAATALTWADLLQARKQAPPERKRRRQAQLHEYSESDGEEGEEGEDVGAEQPCSSGSWGGGASHPAAAAAGLMDLEDDACSAPRQPAPPAQQHVQLHALQQQQQPDGAPLVAATLFADIAARGSVFRYCCTPPPR